MSNFFLLDAIFFDNPPNISKPNTVGPLVGSCLKVPLVYHIRSKWVIILSDNPTPMSQLNAEHWIAIVQLLITFFITLFYYIHVLTMK